MSSLTQTASMPEKHYLNNGTTLKSWLLTVDHKRIALLYLFSVLVMFSIGGIFAILIRLELLTPQADMVTPDVYNRLFTLHGVIMILFFLIPAIPGTLGNFLVPIMVGAKDLAFPKINLLSWYVFNAGVILAVAALVLGGVDTGWTFYTPFSTTFSNSNVILAGLGAFMAGFASILTGLNFLVTIHRMRAPGMTWFRLPLYIWSHYATSIIMILGTPVLAIAIVLIAVERGLGVGIFDPNIGGDPLLFQHLFWFYSHPAVYVMILPAMGIISEIIAAFSRQRIFGYHFVAFSSMAIAILGFLVWGHHLYVSSQSVYASIVFSVLTMLVAVPSAVKMFNWSATLFKGSISFDTPMLYAFGFFGLFTIGGLTGIFCATLGLDVHIHDTYFIVAHFHYVMVGGTVMAFFGGLHYWWPKMTGRMYPEMLARIAAIATFIGFNTTFFPQFLLGYLGMPRRYAVYPPEFQFLNICSTLGATILSVGAALPLFYLAWSFKYGRKAGDNPWGATGLEWETTSPPPTFNFDETPVVDRDPYDYAHLYGQQES